MVCYTTNNDNTLFNLVKFRYLHNKCIKIILLIM